MAADTEKDLQKLRNRFRELADKSYHQNIYTFSGFLGLSEQDVFWQMERELSFVGYSFWGEDRKILRFGNPAEMGYEEEFPVVCIHMKPLLSKFSDRFSHRDFLGALMNLGIDRSTIGDIKVGEKEGYLFCQESIARYICENLDKVKHTNIKCEIVEDIGEVPKEEPEEMVVLASGERIDGVISKVYNMSRSDSLAMFREKKVYVNGRLCENNSRSLKCGETVNVRGYGKFIYDGVNYETKKGKLSLKIRLFR
ncbi:MAG: hypothetical protein IJ282_06980 [Lachnospiraceae bacterium]|nr:hypothetical protein [Lachnospiraceae bacterium]